jgi:hypothetical protein
MQRKRGMRRAGLPKEVSCIGLGLNGTVPTSNDPGIVPPLLRVRRSERDRRS